MVHICETNASLNVSILKIVLSLLIEREITSEEF